MKNLTDFRKTIETGVYPRLSCALTLEKREDNKVSLLTVLIELRLQVKPTPIDWINKSIA